MLLLLEKNTAYIHYNEGISGVPHNTIKLSYFALNTFETFPSLL
jgi:hypothetical protein